MEKEEKITKKNLTEHLINKELAYVGKTIDDVKDDKEWYWNNTLTKEQYEEWKEYSKKVIKKVLKCKNSFVDREFAMFDLMYGLKVIQDDNDK